MVSDAGQVIATGYAGKGKGKNSSAHESVPNVGPIPRGRWIIAAMTDTKDHGPFCLRLLPYEGTVTFGRSGFLIHGDSISDPGNASQGCIILPRVARETIWYSKDTGLLVI